MRKVSAIFFPNTVPISQTQGYTVLGLPPEMQCEEMTKVDEIKIIDKNGEMAPIVWFQIIKDSQVAAEIKESVCHVFYQPESEEL